jgi:hypothetical protein
MLALHPHCMSCGGQSVGYIPQGTPVLADKSVRRFTNINQANKQTTNKQTKQNKK